MFFFVHFGFYVHFLFVYEAPCGPTQPKGKYPLTPVKTPANTPEPKLSKKERKRVERLNKRDLRQGLLLLIFS